MEIGLCGSKHPLGFAKTLGIKKASEVVAFLLSHGFFSKEQYAESVEFWSQFEED